jgi:lysophospholipase L1-like esterase
MRLIGFFLTLLLVSASAYLAGRESVPDGTESYIGRRAWILGEAAERAPKGQILLVGDSLSERSGVTTLCGQQVFNAGISSATLHDLAPLAAKLKASLQPSEVFIALGTNDARLGTDPAAFEAEYRALVGAMEPLRVVIVSLPAVGAGAEIAPEQVAALNRRLQAIPVAKLLPSFTVPTVDGVHPTVEGAALWREKVSAGCT